MLRPLRPRRYRGLARAARAYLSDHGGPVAGSLGVLIMAAVMTLGVRLMTLLRAVHWRDMIIPHDCPSPRDQRADAPVERIYRWGTDPAASGCRRRKGAPSYSGHASGDGFRIATAS